MLRDLEVQTSAVFREKQLPSWHGKAMVLAASIDCLLHLAEVAGAPPPVAGPVMVHCDPHTTASPCEASAGIDAQASGTVGDSMHLLQQDR